MSRSFTAEMGSNGDITVVLVVIPKDELQQLWHAAGMDGCLKRGELIQEVRRTGSRTRDRRLIDLGAFTEIVVIKTRSLQRHVGTILITRTINAVINSHVIDYIDPEGVKWHRVDRVHHTD